MSQTRLPAELRQQVRVRAGGCCEYCRLPETYSFAVHQVDHIIAEKHGGPSNKDNLAFQAAAAGYGDREVSLHPAVLARIEAGR